MSKLQEHVERHERQITAIRNLVHQGMRLVVETRRTSGLWLPRRSAPNRAGSSF